jgi:asparagine synthase (glutamine-hydrolysing)
MMILMRKIRKLGFKVVFSGEGSDEIFGGYLYFYYAPDKEEFHRELVRKTTRLHYYDVLRANKVGFGGQIEVRCPFLDRDVLEVVMNTDPYLKLCNSKKLPDGVHPKMEKYLLRKAFDTP